MTERVATCACGQFRVTCTGEPFRISVCHCLNCQKRSGSSFAAQARWAEGDVEMTGAYSEWTRVGEASTATFRFCVQCGSTVAYFLDSMPGVVAVAIGAFAEPDFPPPIYSVYEGRKHAWIAVVGDGIEHYD
jgi:hypothetical protein